MIRVRQIKVNVLKDSIDFLKKQVAIRLKISPFEILSMQIVKKSIDARKKESIFFVYEVDVTLKEEEKVLKKNRSDDIFLTSLKPYQFLVTGTNTLNHRPIIVGSGPAGLFCAYFLSLYGYRPLIIERGEMVEKRVQSVEQFFLTGKLNPNSNVQFGEGGAGTFSDGKLNTLVKDKRHLGKKVLEIFVENGADKDILYQSHPHLGTDCLREIIPNMRRTIMDLGGEFLFETLLTDIKVLNGKISMIELNHETWISCDVLVLATGHSARDTYEMLYQRGVFMEGKPFAVGVRVEHPQDFIDDLQYGKFKNYLPPAEYKLTYTTKNKRGVYSFCMCPGGYVLNASSEFNRLCVNGMSEKSRNSKNANSAIVVTVNQNDYGTHPLDGMKFQRELEEKAFLLGNGKIPVQLYKDFKNNVVSKSFGCFSSCTKGDVMFCNFNELLPKFLCDSLKEAFVEFGAKIPCFSQDDMILLGVESRTSSPIRIQRNEDFFSNIFGIIPCGEGAGYSGGITTSSIDGILCAEKVASFYLPFE